MGPIMPVATLLRRPWVITTAHRLDHGETDGLNTVGMGGAANLCRNLGYATGSFLTISRARFDAPLNCSCRRGREVLRVVKDGSWGVESPLLRSSVKSLGRVTVCVCPRLLPKGGGASGYARGFQHPASCRVMPLQCEGVGMLVGVGIVVGLGLVLLFVLAFASNGMIERREATLTNAKAALVERYGDGDYHLVMPGPSYLGIIWDRQQLVCGNPVASSTLPFADLRDANVELDGVSVTRSRTETATNRGSQLAGGLIGGALLGPVGLLAGGLSGSTTATSKAIEARKIKSVRLVIRVADRETPLRTVVFCDHSYGDGFEATGPIIAPAVERAAHYHALLRQIIEDRQLQGGIGRSVADRPVTGTAGAAVGLLMLVASLSFPTRADAYDLGKALAGAPEAKLASTKPLDQVERCIFLSDLAAPPIAYRSPDGTRSLIHGGRSQPIFVFELLRSPTGTDVIVWQGKGYVNDVRRCL